MIRAAVLEEFGDMLEQTVQGYIDNSDELYGADYELDIHWHDDTPEITIAIEGCYRFDDVIDALNEAILDYRDSPEGEESGIVFEDIELYSSCLI